MAQQKNLHLIQVLRGIASLLVVLLHVTRNAKETLNKDFLFNAFSFGGSGVDIFFVLSGFIITYTSLNSISQRNKLLPFVRKRVVRIFPTYWIIISGFLIIQTALPAFYKTHFNFSISNIISTYLLLPNHAMVNGVSWTLTYELFFYLLFSFAFLIPNKKTAFILAIIYGLILVIIPLAGYDMENRNPWISLIGFPMNVEFVLGICAAVFITKIPARLSLAFIILGSIMFLAGGIFSDLNYELFPSAFNRVILYGIPAFLIIAGLVKFELAKNIKVHTIFLSLGEASYSLYLLHLPIVAAFVKIIARFNIQNNLLIHAILFLLIIAICFISILFFNLIEKPLINKLNSIGKRYNV